MFFKRNSKNTNKLKICNGFSELNNLRKASIFIFDPLFIISENKGSNIPIDKTSKIIEMIINIKTKINLLEFFFVKI